MSTVASYRLGLYEKSMPNTLTWPEKLAAARAAGFDFIEISVDETDAKLARLDWTSAERQALVRQMDEAGIRIETMCLSGHRRFPLGSPDPQTRARSLEIMEKAVRLAADLGIRVIQIAGYDVYYEPSTPETARLFAEGLAKSVEFASRDGVMLGFETMETEFMNTCAKAMHYVRLIDSPYLQVYPDAGNMTNAAVQYGTAFADDLRSGAGHLAALHLKETVPGKFREIPFGTGHVAFEPVVSQAYAMGVRRYTAEFWYVGQEDWRGTLSEASTFLRAKFPAEAVQ